MLNARTLSTSIVFSFGLATSAWASDQVFSFNQPSFGGNGLRSSYYLNLMESQNQFVEERTRLSTLEQFSADLERRLLSTLSTNIVEEIFGEDRSESGSFTAGGLEVIYETVGDEVIVTITDGVTTTTITVPSITGDTTTTDARVPSF